MLSFVKIQFVMMVAAVLVAIVVGFFLKAVGFPWYGEFGVIVFFPVYFGLTWLRHRRLYLFGH